MTDRIIGWRELSKLVPYCRQHIARLEKAHDRPFPQRVRLGNGPRSRCGWVLAEVEAWIEARMNDRTPPGGAMALQVPAE